ncbi:hypothetical protein GpartN1_g5378.t1 [Galdieria partita]|uniref:Uncharacterized protein n=1 Tax=Galdieria partita TaxID=83374 RepID=A0A9C7Q1R2_9RHOD|nr:hypothetical protein GpartN1_g5378.t1 [Galdieria partita]
MRHTSFVSSHFINTFNRQTFNRREVYLQSTTATFICPVRSRSLVAHCCASSDTPTTSDPPSVTSNLDTKNSKKLYRPIDYPIHTEAYLGSEPIRESLWKYTYERTQREEEADRNLEQLAQEFNVLKTQVEDALRKKASAFDPKEAFEEADAIFTPMEEKRKDPILASIERGCPPDDIDLGDYPYIDVPDIPENLELENLGWVGLKELGASPLPEMIEDIQSRRSGVVEKTRSRRVDEPSTFEDEEGDGEDIDLANTLSVPDFPQESKVYVKEGLGWRIGYEPYSTGEQCATVGSKEYLITMNREEFFHFRRLLMSLDHKLTDMTYHSSELSDEEFSSSHYVVEQSESTNGMEDSRLFMETHPIMDLESDVLRIQAFGRPSWFSLRVFLKRKRPVECSWDAEATQGLLKAVHEVDHVASLF